MKLHKELYGSMRIFHFGKENAIHMLPLAEAFNINDRELRQLVLDINTNKVLCNGYKTNYKIIGDNNGYYMASSEQELNDYRNRLIKRLKTIVSQVKAIDNDNKENQLVFDLDATEITIIKEYDTVEKQFLSVEEMATYLGVSASHFRQMIRNDKNLPYIYVGKYRKFNPSDVVRYLDNQTNKEKK